MRMSSKVTFNKDGYISRLDLKVYPEHLTLKQSLNGSFYLLVAIEEALLKDCERYDKERKDRKALSKKKTKR